MRCDHPPARYFTGFYVPATPPPKPYRSLKDKADDQLWINCCACGEAVRVPPAALRDEAAWKAQRERG